MKLLFILVVLHGMVFQLFCQTKTNPKYDSILAKKYNADEYGMKMYVLVILKTGTNYSTDQKLKDSLFAGHLSNINHMVSISNLVVAGPIEKNEKSYRGIFILDIKSFEEASQLLDADPAINANLLDVEMYNWYGSAALPAYLDVSDKIWKIGF